MNFSSDAQDYISLLHHRPEPTCITSQNLFVQPTNSESGTLHVYATQILHRRLRMHLGNGLEGGMEESLK